MRIANYYLRDSIFKLNSNWEYNLAYNLQNLYLDCAFSFEEFLYYFLHCNIKAAVGLDGISIAVLRCIFYAYPLEFMDIFNTLFMQYEAVPID